MPKEVGKEIVQHGKDYISTTQQRKTIAEILHHDSFQVNHFHLYNSIRRCIAADFKPLGEVMENIHCVECCIESCDHLPNGIHVFFEMAKRDVTEENLYNVIFIIQSKVSKTHGLSITLNCIL